MRASLLQIDMKMVFGTLAWLGTICYIAAYLLLSTGKLKPTSTAYHFLNILGAVGLIAHASYLYDLPNIVVNIIWLLIAAVALIKIRNS